MKPVLIATFILFFADQCLCQVSGKAVGQDSNPLSFVSSVLLNTSDSGLARGTVTDKNGYFLISSVSFGSYLLQLSASGYQPWYSTPFVIKDSVIRDFGVVILKVAGQELEAVVVHAEKPIYQAQPGGITVNVENSVMTRGSSALSVLERSPGVTLDLRNNSLSLNGKNGVEVMLNGKQLKMPMDQMVSLLQSMSADDIQKIELLTTPPARYDAAGNAGLINIVLKKNKRQGTNGSFSFTGGYGLGEKVTAGVSLTHNIRNINLFGSYNFSHDRAYDNFNGESLQDFPPLGGNLTVLFWNNNKYIQNNQNASIGLDASLNAKTRIGSSVLVNTGSERSGVFNRRIINLLPDSLSYFTGTIIGSAHSANLISSAYIERQLSEREKINFELDYLFFDNDSPTDATSSFLEENGSQAGNNDTLFAQQQRGFAKTMIGVGVLKLDFMKQISNKVSLEVGGKGTYTRNSSLSGIKSNVRGEWIERPETSNNILMKERIGGVYASLNARLNVQTNLVIGFRYEYSLAKFKNAIDETSRAGQNRGSLFPNFSFFQQISKHSNWLLSYSKRISRPSYNDLSSFITYNDPFSVFTGNPFLQPTITHNLKLGYDNRGYSFSFLLSRDINPIARYQITPSPEENLMYIGPQNLEWQNNFTFQIDKTWKPKPWWMMNVNSTAGWRQYRETYTILPLEKTWFGYSINFLQTLQLPKRYSIELSGWYNSISYNGTVKTEGFGAVNGGFKKILKNKGGAIQLAVTDLFSSIRYNIKYGTLTKEAFSGSSQVTVTPESGYSPIFKFTYTRSFGSGNAKTQANRAAGSGEEQERIRKN